MKYYTWKLKWEDNEGTNPSHFINTEATRIEPIFANGDISNPDTLIYCILSIGEFDASEFTDWSVNEITSEQILSAAQAIDSGATMNEDGFIVFPTKVELEVPQE
jgi:hypothetical protein